MKFLYFLFLTHVSSFNPKYFENIPLSLKKSTNDLLKFSPDINYNYIKGKYSHSYAKNSLDRIFKKINKKKIKYPDYYDKSNFDWNSAYEFEGLSYSVLSLCLNNNDFKFASNYFRSNIYDIINNYSNNEIRNILDIGCSIGLSTEFLQKKFCPNFIHGIDLNPYFLSIASYRSKYKSLPISYSHQNAENVNDNDKSYDLITSSFLIHEVPNKNIKNIFKESYRLLDNHGIFVIIDIDSIKIKNKFQDSYLSKFIFEASQPNIFNYYKFNIQYELFKTGFKKISKISIDEYNSVWIGKKIEN